MPTRVETISCCLTLPTRLAFAGVAIAVVGLTNVGMRNLESGGLRKQLSRSSFESDRELSRQRTVANSRDPGTLTAEEFPTAAVTH